MGNVPVNGALLNIGWLLFWACNIYTWLIIVRVLLTWISPNPYSPFMRFLSRLTDPALDWARRKFRLALGGLDFSPIILLMILQVVAVFFKDFFAAMAYGFSAMAFAPLLLKSLLALVSTLAVILMALMVARLIMSLVNPSPYNPIVMIVYALTEPLLAPFRRAIPAGPRGLDLRALIFLVLVYLVNSVLLSRLMGLIAAWLDKLAPRL